MLNSKNELILLYLFHASDTERITVRLHRHLNDAGIKYPLVTLKKNMIQLEEKGFITKKRIYFREPGQDIGRINNQYALTNRGKASLLATRRKRNDFITTIKGLKNATTAL